MEPAAIVTFVLIAGFVWGGFALLLVTALRKESAKREASEPSRGPT